MTEADLCMWCRRPEGEHGPPGETALGGPDGRLCPGPGVSSQFFTRPPSRPRGGMTEADLLFAVRVLEGSLGRTLEYDADHPVARERATLSARADELRPGLGFTEASRLARAEWLGRFLAERGAGRG
jgi:hypothetical protein